MDACRLCLEAGFQITPPAIYSGTAAAQIMIVGQAPGITECSAGRPFNAGSGSRLFAWLAGAGIEEGWFRRTQYMTSITKCYPGKGSGGSGDRVPSRAEQSLCRPYLEAEIQLVDPCLIIPVGRLAIERFYPLKPPLEEIVGTRAHVDGRWIVPLPHPSGASRWHQIPANRHRIEEAVHLIREIVAAVIESPG
jgi:uracil-DNA glycosylase